MDLRPRALFLAAVLLAGCGGTNTKAGTSATTTSGPAETAPVSLPGQVNNHGTATAAGATFDLEQDNFYFNPTFVKAKGGTTVQVTLKNEGSSPHTFTIASPAVDVTVDPGKTATADVALPASGTVPFFCRFHRGSGMQGAFVVT
jgi:plastocyanin